MNEQPHQPEILDDDLFKWARNHAPKTPLITSPKQEEERDSYDTCAMCRNGGFCPVHNIRPADISVLMPRPDADYEGLNKEPALTHSRKPKDEIPLAEFIAGISDIIKEDDRKAS
jgi:hypothetical protein